MSWYPQVSPMEKPDHICLIKHDHFKTHRHGTNPLFSGHDQNLKGLSLSRRYIYKFQIFHLFPDNFPNSGYSVFSLILVKIAINLVLSKQHRRRRKTVTMNKNGRERLSNRRQQRPRPDRRRGSRPTSARRPTCWGSRRRTSSSSRRPPRTPWPGPRSLHGAAP